METTIAKKVNTAELEQKLKKMYSDVALNPGAEYHFAPNWDVNLPVSCRGVGDKLPGYENADITSLPMTIQPLSNAKDTELQLQVMLTKGERVKGNAQEGMIGSYFERKVILKVNGN